MERICVYAGASAGARPAYRAAATELARALAERGVGLVYGGGGTGLMGALADEILAAGGEVTGVIPRALVEREVAHGSLTELRVVDSMHERKALMAQLSDGFVALPGGLGTLEELFEAVTWAQLGFHRKPCGLLNAAEYFGPLLGMLDHAVAEGFVPPEYREALVVAGTAGELLERFASFRPLRTPRFLTREEEL